jgi:hypothetical protein
MAAAAAKPGTATRAAPRAKSPARAKTGAKAAATTPAATTPVAPAPAPAPVPAMAPVSATPAGPIAGADLSTAPAAPRRRERSEGQQVSTVSAVFDSIFGSTDVPTAVDAPASPTPSSGSDASGPKTFRRPR